MKWSCPHKEMKITYAALKLLLNDTQRGQTHEREILWRILEKLPDEHTMRAISLDRKPPHIGRAGGSAVLPVAEHRQQLLARLRRQVLLADRSRDADRLAHLL